MAKKTFYFHKGREALAFGANLLHEAGARRTLWLPALYCGNTQRYLCHCGFRTLLYDLNARLLPQLEKTKIPRDDIFLFCNFFGLFPDVPRKNIPGLPAYVIFDSCHDPSPFFRQKTIQANLSVFSFGKSDPRNYYGAVRLESIRDTRPAPISIHLPPLKPLVAKSLKNLSGSWWDWLRRRVPRATSLSGGRQLFRPGVSALRPYRWFLPGPEATRGFCPCRSDLRNIQQELRRLRATLLLPRGKPIYPHSLPFMAENPRAFLDYAARRGLRIFRWPGHENVLRTTCLRRRHQRSWQIEKKLFCAEVAPQ